MKKNIGFIQVDSHLLEYLYKQLIMSDEDCEELLGGIEDMLMGNVTSLLLSSEKVTSSDVLKIGDMEIYQKSRRVIVGCNEVSLTPKEFDILYFLAENRGEVFTKEQIYKAVWSNDYLLDDSNIMAFIRKLRKKIEPDPDAPIYILTIWGIGYKFNDQL